MVSFFALFCVAQTLPAAATPRAVAFVRGADLAVNAAVTSHIVGPLQEHVQVVSQASLRRAAGRVPARDEADIQIAERVAKQLKLTHAVTITQVVQRHGRRRKIDLEIILVRLQPTTTVLSVEQYPLPHNKISAALGRSIVKHLLQTLKEHETTEEKRSAAATRGPLVTAAPEESAADESSPKGRLRLSVALGGAQRLAHISSTQSPTSHACYCGGGALPNVAPALRGDVLLRIDPESSSFGVRASGTFFLASTEIKNLEEQRNIYSDVLDLRGTAFYSWETPIGLSIAPELGWLWFRFPLSDGTFPSLVYQSPVGALQLALDVSAWRFLAGVGMLYWINVGADAVRLGNLNGAIGVTADAAVIYTWSGWEFGIRGGLTQFNTSYAGPTFLYTPQVFQNVSIQDRTLQASFSIGSQFW